MTDRWHAFECFTCNTPGTSGLVFDVRLPEPETLDHAKCPRCGALRELRGTWEASEGGYGGRSGNSAECLGAILRAWVTWEDETRGGDVADALEKISAALFPGPFLESNGPGTLVVLSAAGKALAGELDDRKGDAFAAGVKHERERIRAMAQECCDYAWLATELGYGD